MLCNVLGMDAPVEVMDLGDNIKRQLHGVLKSRQSIELIGDITLHIPVSACTSKILILALYSGVHLSTRDQIQENGVHNSKA